MSVICLVLGGVVGLGYMLFHEHLCNHILPASGGGTWGTALYTVRGVGSGSRDVDAWRVNGTVHRGSGAPSTDDPGSWQPVTSSGKAAPGPDQRIRHRIQIGMFRPIRLDHTNCLQVTIKTHSFIRFFLSLVVP
jgi:hypothetical protein